MTIQETMYPGFTNSPATTLTGDITNVATTIPVAELGVFPAAPNLATIGTGDDAETILYGAKSAASGGGNLTSCTREHDKTGTYGQKLAWLSGTTISRNLTNLDLYALQTNVASLNYANTIEISPTGGDYHTVQAALTANATEYTLFLVYPGVYADDTVYFTANNQSVIGLDNSTTQILGSTTTNVVDFGAFTGCVLNRVTVKITGATSSVHTVTGSSGNIIINDCTLEMTNASYTGAIQPSVINITAGGTCEVKFGFINYSNPVVAAVIKAAILLGAGSYVRLRRGDIQIDGAGASTGTTIAWGIGSGRITATRSVITITDNATTAVVGFYIGGSAPDDEVTNCHIHVTGGTTSATGIWNVGTGTVRSFGNGINVVAGTGAAYSFQISAGATITSVYDDIIAANGLVNAGTFTAVPTIYDEIVLNAYNSLSPDTNAASLDQTELSSLFPLPRGLFTKAGRGTERLCWISYMPEKWDGGAVTINIEASFPTYHASQYISWDVTAVRVPVLDLFTTALAALTPAATNITTALEDKPAYTKLQTASATTYTVSGTGNTILWQITRNATDTYSTEDAWFLTMRVKYKVT